VYFAFNSRPQLWAAERSRGSGRSGDHAVSVITQEGGSLESRLRAYILSYYHMLSFEYMVGRVDSPVERDMPMTLCPLVVSTSTRSFPALARRARQIPSVRALRRMRRNGSNAGLHVSLFGCRSPKLRKGINLVRVTMLQASPYIIHFFDFGEKQAGILPRIPVSRLAPTIAISLNAASYKCLQDYEEEAVYSIKPKS